MLDEGVMVFLSFGCKAEPKRSPGFGFSFRHQSFLEHGFYGAMHHGAVEAKLRGDLVLIEGSSMPQGGENEAACR